MLKLLLDEQISPAVARQLKIRQNKMLILALVEWQKGVYMSVRDEELLTAAGHHGLTLVTYDLKTISPLLKFWGEQDISHGGLILVDDNSIRSNDFGGLVTALEQLWLEQRNNDWRNRIVFLSGRSGTR